MRNGTSLVVGEDRGRFLGGAVHLQEAQHRRRRGRRAAGEVGHLAPRYSLPSFFEVLQSWCFKRCKLPTPSAQPRLFGALPRIFCTLPAFVSVFLWCVELHRRGPVHLGVWFVLQDFTRATSTLQTLARAVITPQSIVLVVRLRGCFLFRPTLAISQVHPCDRPAHLPDRGPASSLQLLHQLRTLPHGRQASWE